MQTKSLVLVVLILAWSDCMAQMPSVPPPVMPAIPASMGPKIPIPIAPIAPLEPSSPKSYKSWSLFIVCHPAWLVPEAQKQVDQLYNQFVAYGHAIGPDHLALWFWLNDDDAHQGKNGKQVKRILDADRNAKFCARLQLPPSKSPYLIFTTTYPGEGLSSRYPNTFPSMADLGHHLILSLNGESPADTTRLLASLADKLIENKIESVPVDSRQYWLLWQRVYQAVRGEVTGLFGRVTLRIDAGAIKADINLANTKVAE